MKPKEKGDLALAQAISYYMSNGYEVCIPIGDKRDFDLVVEKNNTFYSVQVKYAGLYPSKSTCRVALRITGGNQSFHYSKTYTDDAFDLLFVYTAKGQLYEIPWSHVKARNELSIENDKYAKYRQLSTNTLG